MDRPCLTFGFLTQYHILSHITYSLYLSQTTRPTRPRIYPFLSVSSLIWGDDRGGDDEDTWISVSCLMLTSSGPHLPHSVHPDRTGGLA